MPPRAIKAPAPTVEVVAPALALDPTRPLADRIAAVKGDGPDLQRQAKAAGWPSGISPSTHWPGLALSASFSLRSLLGFSPVASRYAFHSRFVTSWVSM